MATKNKKTFDKTEFSKLLTTLSLKEVMKLEFWTENVNKLEKLVVCADELKKMYLCNVCKVVQYGDKNLISHLGGKRHVSKMESVKQLYLPNNNIPEFKSLTNNYKTVKVLRVSNTVGCSRGKAKVNEMYISKNQSGSTKLNRPVQKSKSEKNYGCVSTGIESIKEAYANLTNFKFSDNNEGIGKSKMSDIDQNRRSVDVDSSTVKAIIPNQFHKKLVQEIQDSYVNCESVNSKYSKYINKQTCLLQKEIDHIDETAKNAQTILEKVSNKEIVSIFGLKSLRPDIVKNALPTSSKNTTISCVPISKLIYLSHSSEKNSETIEEISTRILPIEISNHKKEQKKYELDIITKHFEPENVQSQNSATSQHISNCDSIFESTSTVTEILGFLGIEYVIKIMRNFNDEAAKFFCTLCNITTDEIIMHNHILSYSHRLTYCEKHFPTAVRQYRQYISHIPEHQVFKILPQILDKLAKSIEKYHGRGTVYYCYEYPFSKNKQNIVSTVFNRKHASELLGPVFTHIIDLKDVELLIENSTNCKFQITKPNESNNEVLPNNFNRSNYITMNQNAIYNYASHPSFNDDCRTDTVDDETHKLMVDMFLRETRQNQVSRFCRQPSGISKRSRSKSNSPDRKRIRSNNLIIPQWNVERKSLSPLRDDDIWQAYRHLVDHSVRDLNQNYEIYIPDPEEHPMYREEWQSFWKRRKDELIAAGINHRSYNYQNEWIQFFNARLEELYNQDVESIKIKCRERLCLPMTNDYLSNSKYHVHISENLLKLDKPIRNDDDIKIKLNKYTNNINIIHVLRLLTALEDYLGSLGPTITDLLAKALKISKLNPDKANILLLTSKNCSILEAAKDKFTGLIISNILDPTQERALKKAINDTEQLLHFSTTIRTELGNSKTEPNRNIIEKESHGRLNAQDRFDKTELASKLATSLISQGKTTINHEQLEQIFQDYSIMEKKKQRNTTTSTSFVNNGNNH